MKKNIQYIVSGMAVCLTFVAFSCKTAENDAAETDYVSYVDPYIGSGEHGHVFVGASVPFGAVQLGPTNIHKGWDWCSGYHYSDSVLIGFSHTHLSGTGCADLGDVLVMPFTGEVRTARGEQDNIEGACSSYYSHENEEVSPGYYSITLESGVHAELTATERVGMHHYEFPDGAPAHLLINLKEGIGDRSYDTYLKKTDDYTIEGYRFSHGWSPQHKVFFTMAFDTPVASLAVFNDDEPAGADCLTGEKVKGVVSFGSDVKEVQVKVAISSVSCENAAENMQAELPHWDFAQVRSEAADKWNKQLACVTIDTPDERAKKIFYTSVYHMFIAPTLYCDVNGEFRGQDDKVYTGNTWTNYSTFSLWDTYRTLSPLYTIVAPEKMSDIVNSFLSIYDQQGKLPIWHLVGGETDCMPGYSSVPIIADIYLKGFGGFDAERALGAMKATATNMKQKGIPYVMEKGYIPCDKVHEATSIAMEYAVDDWGTALMAKKMGKKEDYETYIKRGRYYTKYYDRDMRFVRPLLDDGSRRTPYDPFRSVYGVGDFTEGTGWQYTFFVPQHPEGLIEILGGDAAFVSRLDSLFIAEGDMGENAASDITGLIGQYAHGNEPSHHVAYLYPYAGEQWKAAEKVRYIQDEFYTDRPEGIIGNEDCGQMSAWHVMSALGFYQVNPSNGVFVFGSPLFGKASIRLGGGKTFDVVAENNSKDNIYIQSATLNGKPYEKSFITYEDIMKGGCLSFVMGSTPNKQFGSAPENRPKSAE